MRMTEGGYSVMTETPLRFLVVDDDPGHREICRRFLEQYDAYKFDFLEADLGEDGLALCQAEALDCILLDYHLPDLDGLEFLRTLAADKGGMPVPVIMMTGDGNETLVADAMKAGAVDYLPKHMLSPERLGRAVANAVEKHKLRTTVANALRPTVIG